ncbi:Oxysterol-binding family protein [Cladophialophora carrionii]|uniref:Oxysterol-binding family protein n=1 Tax=Cladophialophora carrionii TaxID=86049 RepID=A0A1C1CM21_9EURO|nr:Oxysterol-binding family protein [Cladophialophora carrionii]
MTERPPHKRSKSARVLNLLRSDNLPKESGSDTDQSPVTTTTSATGPFSANSPLTPVDGPRLSPLSPTVTRTSQLAMDSSEYSRESDTSHQVQAVPSGISADQSTSIEDSVRTFRVFEVLRGKDTTAIAKAIKESIPSSTNPFPIPGTTILHLAIQCAEPSVVEQVLREGKGLDVNAQDKEGNTALHLAAQLGRTPIVRDLLEVPDVNDAISNRQGKLPIDLARTPEIFQQLQLARSIFLDEKTKEIHAALAHNDYKKFEAILVEPRVEATLDVNALELPTEPATVQSGGTLLHEAARKKDIQLAQLLLLHGADPFRRDRKGRLPQHVTQDDRTKAILKKSPAAAAAQRGIQEKAILGNNPSQSRVGAGPGDTSKDAREMKGYLKKWTNYTSGYKLRWFVLEEGVLSYYKHQDDAGSACRGAINMRIAKLHMDPQDKTRFEIHGKSSVKYHLKANHVVEAKRWFWALNNAIQFTKDEAKEEEKRRTLDTESLRHARGEPDQLSATSNKPKQSTQSLGVGGTSSKISFRSDADGGSAYDSYDASLHGDELQRVPTSAVTDIPGEEDADGDDASSREVHHPGSKDAFNITAQSAKLQLDLIARVSDALTARQSSDPATSLSDPDVTQALQTYQTAVNSLNGLVADLLKISRDRDAYWQYRLDRDADARRMWEESMAKIAYEHEDLKKSIAESEDKRKRTKRALKEALEGQSVPASRPGSMLQPESPERIQFAEAVDDQVHLRPEANIQARSRRKSVTRDGNRRKSIIAQYTNLSDSESGDDEEFFDAIDEGKVEVVEPPLLSPPPVQIPTSEEQEKEPFGDERALKQMEIEPSYAGYEQGIRKRLKMDADNRPKISLWGILKSMIGKDMTKMTLPVSFNEPTSLLQRVAEDMEYADLLDIAADRPDATERLVYVAAFAASEYASTIGRVAKPFNPLLGETYEYVRPDKGYRFFIEQVSHHPPIGAAYAESARWDYWGESAVKSKFYGRSFDINPLGTWFLRLRPSNGGPPELYTWKKVTSSVVGIITGNPTVDNYGTMEIKNWTSGEVCVLEFKQRGWKASSAYQVFGKVMGVDGVTKWSIGGRWNDKIYARVTEGFEDEAVGEGRVHSSGKGSQDKQQAFLVWEAHQRPQGIPFNLTPFVVTLNDVNDTLRPHLPPTDTRLRPDQRAMEDGAYDFAATEKNRVEEKQRAARRKREAAGEEWKPKWFEKRVEPVTGESYWETNGLYWKKRAEKDWNVCDDIF